MEPRKTLYEQYLSLRSRLTRLYEKAGTRHKTSGQPGRLPEAMRHSARPGSIPAPLTPCIGRDRELAALKDLLQEVRLLVLVGPGGCGKTRLALELAASTADTFPDGSWWLDVHDITDPEAFQQAVASTLGVLPRPGRSAVEAIIGRFRSRQALLILDNCEHLVQPCAALAEAALRACPGLRLLVASRERLGLAGEVRWSVPPLARPPRGIRLSVEEALVFDAVRLFVACGRAVSPSFMLTAENIQAVAEICQRLDGLPLAIELAASRLVILSPREIANRLNDHSILLAARRRDAPSYHHALRATVERSYHLLSDPERRLFNRASVFSGGFTLEGAEAVCAGEPLRPAGILDLVCRLAEASMITVEENGRGGVQYRLLEAMRDYGRERLAETGEADAVRAAHAAYYEALPRR